MINFMIFVIFIYVLYKVGILKTLMSMIYLIGVFAVAYFTVLKPLFERFENLKFYLFVFTFGLIAVGYMLQQLSIFVSNFKDKDKEEDEDNVS